MDDLETLLGQYEDLKNKKLNLNIQRGQPSDDNLALSNPMLTIVGEKDLITPSHLEIRNYPGGFAGLPEARAMFAEVLGIAPEETVVGNNASLEMMVNILMWALIRGMKNSTNPWSKQNPQMIVTVPGYDRHFQLLEQLGFSMLSVPIGEDGPDMDRVAELARADERVKGILFVPTYSNPTGDTISEANVLKLAQLKTVAEDFTIFADDAYCVLHLTEEKYRPPNLLRACAEAGHSDRVMLFSSTSKITFAGAGLGFMGMSRANLDYFSPLLSSQSIGPNKIEQYRHYKFLSAFPGGIPGLMEKHAQILRPRFETVQRVLTQELASTKLASWTNPRGGYFISLDTDRPVADRVVKLVEKAGVSLTPAGATFPKGKDPRNKNIRIAPSRPPVAEIEQAMRVLALCIKLASAEFDAKN